MIPDSPGRALFTLLMPHFIGQPHEVMIDVGGNMVINAIRQKNKSREAALREFDEFFGKLKGILEAQYNVNGNRNTFLPVDQVIQLDLSKILNS